MSWKILSRAALLVMFLVGFIVVLVLFFHFTQQSIWQMGGEGMQTTESNPILDGQVRVYLEEAKLPVGKPVRLVIPKLNVDAYVEHVGLDSGGAMDIPSGPSDVAWFELGQRPGERGSAVFSGHYGWKDNIPAVFDTLYTLHKGDRIYVEDEKGAITVFSVRTSRRYDPTADASDVFGSSDGKAHLNLVTCEGIWNEASKSYSKRLVVFADEEIQ